MTGSSNLQPAVLTIAGSDSSGGAGIQADLKTFAAHGCYGTSAITALTAQNTAGVQDVFPSSPEFLQKQIISVLSDIEIKAIKTGMLFDAQNTRAAVSALRKHYHHSESESGSPLPPLVVDPVCVSTSGHTLLDPSAIDVIIEELFPVSTLITPNKAEAELFLSRAQAHARSQESVKPTNEIQTLSDMLSAAEQLASFGSRAVLFKGGHLTISVDDLRKVEKSHPEIQIIRDGFAFQNDDEDDESSESEEDNMEILRAHRPSGAARELVVDVLHIRPSAPTQKQGQDRNTIILCRPRIDSPNTHGTGCTLSSAIAARLALGFDLIDAVQHATRYTHLGIETASSTVGHIGHGHGPLNHFHSMEQIVVPRITPTNPYPLTTLLIHKTAAVWKAYVEHDFVKLLGKGTLPKEKFIYFIKQDYLYLRYYARAYALLAAKSTSFSAISSATQTILNVLHEIKTHKTFCASFGISEDELEKETEENAVTTAYGGYLVDVGLRGDTMMLLMALLSCLLGYGEVGLWLKKNAKKKRTEDSDERWVVLEGNPYLRWIKDYSGEDYQRAVSLGLETIESRAAADPPSLQRLEEWCNVWKRCTELEKGFWDMAMNYAHV